MNSFSDIELWTLVREGNATAFEMLYHRHWERCYTLGYWHLLDQESAKDLVQELFIDLWEKRGHINIVHTVEGYLKISMRNRVLNHIRSANLKRKHYTKATSKEEISGLSVEEINNARELMQLYKTEIGKLPAKMKEVYILNKEKGHSISEIAQALSLSEQTVKNQLTTALKKVRKGLEHYYLLGLIILLVMGWRMAYGTKHNQVCLNMYSQGTTHCHENNQYNKKSE